MDLNILTEHTKPHKTTKRRVETKQNKNKLYQKRNDKWNCIKDVMKKTGKEKLKADNRIKKREQMSGEIVDIMDK